MLTLGILQHPQSGGSLPEEIESREISTVTNDQNFNKEIAFRKNNLFTTSLKIINFF